MNAQLLNLSCLMLKRTFLVCNTHLIIIFDILWSPNYAHLEYAFTSIWFRYLYILLYYHKDILTLSLTFYQTVFFVFAWRNSESGFFCCRRRLRDFFVGPPRGCVNFPLDSTQLSCVSTNHIFYFFLFLVFDVVVSFRYKEYS